MNYTKPEVAVLGEALCVIEKLGKTGGQLDAITHMPNQNVNPAYDLDE